MTNYYKILGISHGASKEEIRRAYRDLAKKFHPDVNKNADADKKFALLNEANAILMDDAKRKRHDLEIKYGETLISLYFRKKQQEKKKHKSRTRPVFVRRRQSGATREEQEWEWKWLRRFLLIIAAYIGIKVLLNSYMDLRFGEWEGVSDLMGLFFAIGMLTLGGYLTILEMKNKWKKK